MAFSTRRGRPRKPPAPAQDIGTPELRLKHALGLTAEPIDLCLTKRLITAEQHWCGLHLRWLYTLCYGAPSLTTQYAERDTRAQAAGAELPAWRAMREREYRLAAGLLQKHCVYEPVMRLCVFNEPPAFLHPHLHHQVLQQPAMARALAQRHRQVTEGLDMLVRHWRAARPPSTPCVNN